MSRRAAALVLVVGAFVALASLSPAASGAGDQAQIAVFSYDGDCSGFLLETLSGVVTGCRTIPYAVQGGNWSIAADGTMVGGGAGGGPDVRPVTLVRPDNQAVVLDSNPNDFDPAISPDGSKVAFARAVPENYVGARPSNIWVMNTDGTGLKEIAKGHTSTLKAPTFSPDGNTIAYSCAPSFEAGSGGVSQGCGPLPDGGFRQFATLLINTDGSNNRVILLNHDTQTLSWSADGKEIATESIAPCKCADTPDNTEVFIYHADGSDLFSGGDPSQNLNPVPSLQVTHETDVYGGDEPQFLAGSNSQLVFYRAVDGIGGNSGYDYSINLDGTGRQELSLFGEGADYGLIIPAASGGGAPAFVNVMRVHVPTVHKLSLSAAHSRLHRAGLNVGKIQHAYSAGVPKNAVVSQNPAAGKYAHRVTRRGPNVKLTLSLGPPPAARRK
jgi:WD40 repeat protein